MAKKHSGKGNLFEDHPHFWWLILIFLGLCVVIFWKVQQNNNQTQLMFWQNSPIQQVITPVPNVTGMMKPY